MEKTKICPKCEVICSKTIDFPSNLCYKPKISEKEYDVSYLDQQLLNTLIHLRNKWLEPYSGFVACTLIDNGKSVTTTNNFITGNRIRHAEFNAVNLFEEKYGVISLKALLVVTLSPCIVYSEYREDSTCSRLLLDKKITRVHMGLMHEKQGDPEVYRNMGFDISLTNNQRVKRVSKSLLDLYVANKNLIVDDLDRWSRVKKDVGLEIFR